MVGISIRAETKKEKTIVMILIAPLIISILTLFIIPFFLIGQKVPDWYQTLAKILTPVIFISFGLTFVYGVILSSKSTVKGLKGTVRSFKNRAKYGTGYDQRTRAYQYEQRKKYGMEDRCSEYEISDHAKSYYEPDVKVELGSPAGTTYDLYLDGRYMGAMSGVVEVPPGFHRVCVKDADEKAIFDEMMNFDSNVSLTVQITNGISELNVKFT